MNLKAAYRKMLSEASHTDVKLSRQSLYNARQRLIAGEYPKDTTMRKRLLKAKWVKIQDEQWIDQA